MCFFTCSSNKSAGKKMHQIKIIPLLIENICVLYDHWHLQSNELTLKVIFLQNSWSNNIKVFVMQLTREISTFWAAKFLSNNKQPFSGCRCELLFKTIMKEV